MTDYTAIDRDELYEQLRHLSNVLEEVELSDEQSQTAENAFSEINGIVHKMNKPIHIEDRSDGFEIVVTE